MMKRILIVVCLLAIMGSTFASDCKSDEYCCLRTRFRFCALCCKAGDRDDPDWTKPVDCKTDEHCCVKSAAGGCAVCCPNKIDIGHILAIFKGIKDKLPELMNEMNGMKERDDPDWTKPVDCKLSEHCCRKSAAGGCAKCCPNKIQMGGY